jgi:hypothetical protein
MRHVWNEKYRAVYERTYRVLYDAGINEKLADELATQRTLVVTLPASSRAPENKVHQMHATMLGQLLGHDLLSSKKCHIFRSYFLLLAERGESSPPSRHCWCRKCQFIRHDDKRQFGTSAVHRLRLKRKGTGNWANQYR